MKTFEQIAGLTGDQALEVRVKNVVKNVSAASRAKVEALKQEFRDLQSEMFNHMDIGVQESTSLRIEMKENPSEWVDKLYNMAIKMRTTSEKINIAVNVHNKLFPNNPTEGLDSEDLELIEDVCGSKEEAAE